jgi:dienelactone hydrolase
MHAGRLLLLVSSLSLAACGSAGVKHDCPSVPQAAAPPAGAPRHESIEYAAGAVTLEGYLAIPDGPDGDKRPGVVVFHDWMGLGPNPKMRADELAKLGYVALAADLYGKGVRPANAAEAGKLAGQYKEDRATLRARGRAALDRLVASGRVDPDAVAAIGYCFGGTAALELARSGAPLAATVSFHGGLATPHPEDAKNIHGRVLVLHGADDPFVKAEEVAGFEAEMRAAKVDWTFVAYGGAVHAFTVDTAGNDPSKGAAYDARADHRSWEAMRGFFDELWGRGAKR